MAISSDLWAWIGDFVSFIVIMLTAWILFLVLADKMYLDMRLVAVLACGGIALRYLYTRHLKKTAPGTVPS